MIKLENEIYIIGFDNGYQFVKTAGAIFDNGVRALGKVEPSIREHSLKYERKYYKAGEGRAAITENKVSDENARLLTMAAIAKELETEGVCKAEVILAVGLPFSDYGREKKILADYYMCKPALKYEYEGIRYDITIKDVMVYPQCYSAVAPRLFQMREDYLIVDIGSKTTDIIYLKGGIPVESRCITIEKAMVKWMKQIQGNLQVRFGRNVPESEILKVILKQQNFLPRGCANLIREMMREQLHLLELELEEREYDLEYTNLIYVGGGAAAMRNFSEPRSNVAYDTDIHANAKGYEFLTLQRLKKKGVA